jgi:hypothetical protein
MSWYDAATLGFGFFWGAGRILWRLELGFDFFLAEKLPTPRVGMWRGGLTAKPAGGLSTIPRGSALCR